MRTEKYILSVVAALALGCLGFTGPGTSLVEEGNRLFREGDYEGALARYNRALLELPDAEEIRYNIGGVRHRQGDLEAAAALYGAILDSDDPAVSARAAYNLGNTFFRKGDYSRAAGAYRTALRIDPDDEDARYNYELARKFELEPPPPPPPEPEPDPEEPDDPEEEEREDPPPPPEPEDGEEEEEFQETLPEELEDQEPFPEQPDTEELDPEDVERLLDAMLSEEKDYRAEMREKELEDREEVYRDW